MFFETHCTYSKQQAERRLGHFLKFGIWGASPNASAIKYATEYTNYAVSQKKEDGDFYMVSLRRPTYQQAYMWSVILTVLSKLNDISTSQAVIYTVKGNISQNGARDM